MSNIRKYRMSKIIIVVIVAAIIPFTLGFLTNLFEIDISPEIGGAFAGAFTAACLLVMIKKGYFLRKPIENEHGNIAELPSRDTEIEHDTRTMNNEIEKNGAKNSINTHV